MIREVLLRYKKKTAQKKWKAKRKSTASAETETVSVQTEALHCLDCEVAF